VSFCGISQVHNYYIDKILKFSLSVALFAFIKKVIVTNIIFLPIYGVSVIQLSEPKGIKEKIRRRKLRSVNWQGALKQKRIKRT